MGAGSRFGLDLEGMRPACPSTVLNSTDYYSTFYNSTCLAASTPPAGEA